ncbi:hypothetical protein VFPPC_18380 [Pochonia chlamydosporia 170]|uniref:Uncharacterized protein n=1 Tax=Pochonia chlamydosporia 170 TaxID=1380566 RepID=A0A219APB8_METCM|nr:hypothetical protein VFPPC_18380 [Pochonia chlamydosporia 170]OWT42439.1 hypothetical protein VFPPC_18380 [Pochonia chlamydosporia 170]
MPTQERSFALSRFLFLPSLRILVRSRLANCQYTCLDRYNIPVEWLGSVTDGEFS